ncbi:chemotaxis protein CheB [Segetibacter sp.]|jgi:chemotaxis response regulator CheB|uniref:chemotaxis protein CheB n=1 Tax=Segetibacter sp. TaxID=2231182 RepID=UPI0026228927|nr:chemotaxis protein CheB [Segetibacter sp.]MCW3078654.1 chemotaxis protein CheR [Segetibacter sp.]
MNLKFVVAIGYSEGGIEHLLKFFDNTPHDQATYVILRHVPIGQRGLLRDVLQRHSKLEIVEAEDGMAIENDKVYIPPSNSYMTIKNDTFYLHQRLLEHSYYNSTIDTFLESLAKDKAHKSIAVILSGNGADGAVGVAHIHKAGGLVIAQAPATCSHPQMPQAVIDTQGVDQVLAPHEMPAFITKHVDPVLKNENLVRTLKRKPEAR